MTHIHTETHINIPIDTVFAYVTTPAHWPEWHPSSLSVRGAAADHSGVPGQQVIEAFRVAGRRGSVVWTVIEREEPRRWTIRGAVEGGGEGTITYTLAPSEAGTTFARDFTYTMQSRLLRLLDVLILRRRVEAESREALQRLKGVLESG